MSLRAKLLCIVPSVIILPVIALAAFTSPSDLLIATQFAGKPLDVNYAAHVAVNATQATVWVKGKVQGKDAKTEKANLKVTVDIADATAGTVRVRGQIRAVDGVVYARVDSMTKKSNVDLDAVGKQIKMSQWYSAPIDQTATQELQTQGLDQDKSKEFARKVIDAALGMQSSTVNGETIYSLQIKPTAAKELAVVFQDFYTTSNYDAPAPTAAKLQTILDKLSVHIKVNTGTADTPKSIKLYASYTDQANPGFSVAVQGQATVLPTDIVVVAPQGALSIMDQYKQMGGSSPDLPTVRDAQRRADVNTILNAVYQYYYDHNGNFPAGITTTKMEICGTVSQSCTGFVNLNILAGSYVVQIPSDPLATGNGTQYFIEKDARERITVSTSLSENASIIEVTR